MIDLPATNRYIVSRGGIRGRLEESYLIHLIFYGPPPSIVDRHVWATRLKQR